MGRNRNGHLKDVSKVGWMQQYMKMIWGPLIVILWISGTKTCSSISLYKTSQNSKHIVRGSSELLLCGTSQSPAHIPLPLVGLGQARLFRSMSSLEVWSSGLTSMRWLSRITNSLSLAGRGDSHKVVNNGDTWIELTLTCSSLAPWGDSPKWQMGYLRNT